MVCQSDQPPSSLPSLGVSPPVQDPNDTGDELLLLEQLGLFGTKSWSKFSYTPGIANDECNCCTWLLSKPVGVEGTTDFIVLSSLARKWPSSC